MEAAWADGGRLLLEVALEQQTTPTRLHFLTRWWCRKYGIPSKDPRLSEYTIEELYLEFLEDRIEEAGGPDKFVMNVGTDDDPVFIGGGASEIEEKLARGEKVDLLDGLDDAERAKIEKFMRSRVTPPAEAPDGEATFDDKYGGG